MYEGSGLCKSNISLSVFEQYFNSVNNLESPFFTADEDILHFIDRYERNEFDIMFHELNLPFSLDEIKKGIKQLCSNKSSGPDLYINEMCIHSKDVLAPYLLLLFMFIV